jgi:transketolase
MRADLETLETSPRIVPPRVLADAIRMLAADAAARGIRTAGMPMGVIDRFGESAPAAEPFQRFGFTPERVAGAVRAVLR